MHLSKILSRHDFLEIINSIEYFLLKYNGFFPFGRDTNQVRDNIFP